jgi:phage shock protein PspC (stress-responsive transcriptional regulator)
MEPQSDEATRLVRRHHGRMIAGVCQGIADHFHIDPIVVRVVFVVAVFFGGAGAIAYVAAWLLIPEEDETASIGERIVREHRWGRVAGIVLIVIAVSSLARPLWWIHGGVVFAVLLIIGGLYLLSPASTRPESTRTTPEATPTAPPTTTQTPPTAGPAPTTLLTDTEPVPAPGPVLEVPRRRRRRGGIVSLTLGLLFVGGGIVGLIVASGNSVEPAYVFAGGLIIVGAALVLTTWIGRGFVLIPVGVVLVALMSASTVIDVPMTGGVGRKDVTPLTLADLHDEYHLGVGELRLDLTHVTFDRGTTRHVKATVGVGHLLVRIPRNVVVELHGHAGMGAVQFLDDHDGGVRVDRDTTLSAPGESVPHIAIDAEVGLGQVEVQDAAA